VTGQRSRSGPKQSLQNSRTSADKQAGHHDDCCWIRNADRWQDNRPRSDGNEGHQSGDLDLRHPCGPGRHRAWNRRDQAGIDTSRTLLIQSWTDTAAFAILAGEPALTVLPNLVFSGVLTVITALVLAIWSVAFVQRRGGGLVLILLSMALLLVGGLAPPLVGLILGIAGCMRCLRDFRNRARCSSHCKGSQSCRR